MFKYLTGAAALALAASALHADPGGGHGKGGGPEAHGKSADKGNSGAKAHGNAGQMAKAGDGHADKGPKGNDRVERGHGNRDLADDRGRDRVEVREDRREDVRVVRRDDDRDRFDWSRVSSRGLVDGCPPGLAKKNNGCMPPGQLKTARALGFADRPDWWGFDRMDGRFAYVDGNLVRLSDNGGIAGFLPLLGGALAPGNVWPSAFAPVTLPAYYQDYYGLGPVDSYRLYDDALFNVDPQTQAITSIAALLTGDNFAVGQPLPLGYDVYNVPYSYRDRYADGPDSLYRYSDGYVYQADPTTQLITAAIQLLT